MCTLNIFFVFFFFIFIWTFNCYLSLMCLLSISLVICIFFYIYILHFTCYLCLAYIQHFHGCLSLLCMLNISLVIYLQALLKMGVTIEAPIPRHITGIYIFAVMNLLAMLCISSVSADIIVVSRQMLSTDCCWDEFHFLSLNYYNSHWTLQVSDLHPISFILLVISL